MPRQAHRKSESGIYRIMLGKDIEPSPVVLNSRTENRPLVSYAISLDLSISILTENRVIPNPRDNSIFDGMTKIIPTN